MLDSTATWTLKQAKPNSKSELAAPTASKSQSGKWTCKELEAELDNADVQPQAKLAHKKAKAKDIDKSPVLQRELGKRLTR